MLYRVVAQYNNIEKSLMMCCVDAFGAKKRLEPSHPKAHGPEPCASNNFAIWAILLKVDFNVRESRINQRSNLIGTISFGS